MVKYQQQMMNFKLFIGLEPGKCGRKFSRHKIAKVWLFLQIRSDFFQGLSLYIQTEMDQTVLKPAQHYPRKVLRPLTFYLFIEKWTKSDLDC